MDSQWINYDWISRLSLSCICPSIWNRRARLVPSNTFLCRIPGFLGITPFLSLSTGFTARGSKEEPSMKAIMLLSSWVHRSLGFLPSSVLSSLIVKLIDSQWINYDWASSLSPSHICAYDFVCHLFPSNSRPERVLLSTPVVPTRVV
jgi:hypothetical protein